MGYKLPEMKYADGIRQHTNVSFGGINHNLYAQDGELYDAENLTTDLYPLMGSRQARSKVPLWSGSTGMCNYVGGIIRSTNSHLVSGENENHVLAELPDKTWDRELIPFGRYVIIMPDKVVYDSEDHSVSQVAAPIEILVATSARFEDGTLYGEAATGNTIHSLTDEWAESFHVGDAVVIHGTDVATPISAIIREIEGGYLRFDENTFSVSSAWLHFNVSRSSPLRQDSKLFVHRNRLWTFRGNTIYASKLGDPFNWNFFDGTAEDSWSLEIPSGYGTITAGVSYTYPTFFKEDRIFRIYGDKPSSFQLTETVALGAIGNSCAVVNNTLYYASRAGVMAYTGGTPAIISRALGKIPWDTVYVPAGAGTDGVKYYLSPGYGKKMHIFDPRFGTWQKEDDAANGTRAFAWHEAGLMMLRKGQSGSEVWCNTPDYVPPTTDFDYTTDAPVQSFAEFGDFIEGDPNSKTISKLIMRVQLGANATLQVKISIDDGAWEDYATLTNPIPEGQPEVKPKVSKYLAIVPRRCDHFRLKLIGGGEWVLYSLTRETASGSQLKTV